MNLFYKKTGKGKPLILLHGSGGTHRIFDRAIPLLAEHFTVYAIDSRGHGRSDAISEYHYADMMGDIKRFIDNHGIVQPILYGFSDGAIVGLLLACEYPKLLSQLIISGANTVPDGVRSGWRKLFQIVNKLVKNPRMKMMLEEPNITREMLRQIEVPTTVLSGSRDIIKRSHTEYIAENIRNSVLHILPGEGHGTYVQHSARVAKLILKAIQGQLDNQRNERLELEHLRTKKLK